MTFIWFPRPELFFQRKYLFFGPRHFVRQRCALFSYDFFFMNLQGFLRLELLFQRECLFFGLRHFVRRCGALFSHGFTNQNRMNLQGF